MSILAKHSLNKVDKSNIITLAKKAKEEKIKDNEVINATIGMLFDENEEFYVFDCVKKAESKINDIDKYQYTNSVGTAKFIDGVIDWVFLEHSEFFKKEMHAKLIATPGGSGAISNTFSNYLNPGEKVLLPSYMWSNYKQVAYENFLGFETYNLFKNNKLDLDAIKEKFIEMKHSQGRILFVLNDPCHNPTGYSMNHEEWKRLIEIINELTADNTPFIFLYDMAYIDYNRFGLEDSRLNIRLFGNLNPSVLTILAFSGSKTLGLYGLRIGAMIGVSKDEQNVIDFMNANQFSARTKYSMASTLGMNLIGEIFTNSEYRESFARELDSVRKMLIKRADAFLESSKEIGLEMCPFVCGYFITIPCENDFKVYEYLTKKKIHVIPLGNALRVTLASINLEHAKLLPFEIYKAIQEVNK